MAETKHPGLPYFVGDDDHNLACVIGTFENGETWAVANKCSEQTADFIVRACNSHYELVEALRELCEADAHGELDNDMFARARAALKLATREKE